MPPVLNVPAHLKPDHAVLAKSYITAFANSEHNSRVQTAYRPLSALEMVAKLSVTNPLRDAPRGIVVRPNGSHVAVETRGTYEVFSATGRHIHGAPATPGEFCLYAFDAALGVSVFHVPWEQAPAQPPLWHNDTMIAPTQHRALRIADGRAFVALLSLHSLTNQRGMNMNAFSDPMREQPAQPGEVFLWNERQPNAGVAAIGSDNRIAMAMLEGRFVVYRGDGGPQRDNPVDWDYPYAGGVELDTRHRAGAAIAMSIVGQSYQILSSQPPVDAADPRRDWATFLPIYLDTANAAGAWTSWLHQLDAQGNELAAVEVPISVRQPPIDATGGRVLLAGNGLAAVEAGHIVWQHASTQRVRATAYIDGTLAVVDGQHLHILSRDGAKLAELPMPNGEIGLTPPAIASDGTVWVATQQALYAARPSVLP